MSSVNSSIMALPAGRSPLQGNCPAPFLQEEKFPLTGGLVSGRLCIPIHAFNATCCIPCPVTDWTYSDGFEKRTEAANWVNVAAAFATAFLLLSFVILSVKWTHRHYLSICLALGVLCIELAFIIPLGSQPDQCFNEITPNDMTSDLTCAFSGAFLLFGGFSIVMWVFFRALLLHLQICWQVVAGPKFFYSALALGWGIPAAIIAATFSLTGVSYRFGNVCHINHKNSLADYWGPLLAFAAIALVLQFITMGYCIQVYLRSLLHDTAGSSSVNSQLPDGSTSTRSARQAYRRVKRVVQTQWRGAMVVLLIIFEVVFFSVVFVSLDNSSQITPSLMKKATPWLQCLVLSGGNKNQCLPQAAPFVASEKIVLVVLIFLGLSGFWCLLFLGRWSMVLGWRDLFKRKLLAARGEFVSADAYQIRHDQKNYEMIGSARSTPALNLAPPGQAMLSPSARSPSSPDSPSNNEYFGRITIESNYPASGSTYSSPMTPISRAQRPAWDLRRNESYTVRTKDYAR